MVHSILIIYCTCYLYYVQVTGYWLPLIRQSSGTASKPVILAGNKVQYIAEMYVIHVYQFYIHV